MHRRVWCKQQNYWHSRALVLKTFLRPDPHKSLICLFDKVDKCGGPDCLIMVSGVDVAEALLTDSQGDSHSRSPRRTLPTDGSSSSSVALPDLANQLKNLQRQSEGSNNDAMMRMMMTMTTSMMQLMTDMQKQQQTTNNAGSSTGAKEVPQIHPKLLEEMKKTAQAHFKSMLKLAKTRKRLEKLQKEIADIESDKLGCNSSDPNVSLEMPELDHTWSTARGVEACIKLDIPCGTSRRHAIKLAINTTRAAVRHILVEAEEEHLRNVAATASELSFTQKMEAIVIPDSVSSECGIRGYDNLFVSSGPLVAEKTRELYAAKLKQVEKVLVEENMQKEKRLKVEDSNRRDLEKQEPEILLNQWVEEKFESFRQTLTPGDRPMGSADEEAKKKRLELQQNRDLLKAIKSDEAALDPHSKGGKGKGKSKGKKGKGKGKGKGKSAHVEHPSNGGSKKRMVPWGDSGAQYLEAKLLESRCCIEGRWSKRKRLIEWRQRQRKREKILRQSSGWNRFLDKCFGSLPYRYIMSLLQMKELRNNIYYIDSLGCTPRHPNYDEVPWHLIWLLTSFNRKHIFAGSSMAPPMEKILQQILDFENRVKWRVALKDSEMVNRNPLLACISRKARPCSNIVCGETYAYLGLVRKLLAKHMKQAGLKTGGGNFWYLAKSALHSLETGKLKAMLTDKDGGFCISPYHVYKDAVNQTLLKPEYQELCSSDAQLETGRLNREYARVCSALSDALEIPGIGNRLLSSCSNPNTKLAANIVLTCKTHKPSIKFRNIHACTAWKFGSLSQVLARLINERIFAHEHLLKDSLSLVPKLRELKASGSRITFAQFDVEEFFMSGAPHVLASLNSQLFPPGKLREAVFRGVYFLLDNQFCVHHLYPERIFKVVVGSGMGLPHSGAVADAALYMLIEQDIQSMLKNHGLLTYHRLKDDILVSFSRDTEKVDISKFGRELISGAAPFKIKCESVGRQVEFLELDIRAKGVSLNFRPRIKVTALNVPRLQESSAHPGHVHSSWPVCLLSRRMELCSCLDLAKITKETFLHGFARSHPHPRILDRLRKVEPKLYVPRESSGKESCDLRLQAPILVLPYHPNLSGPLEADFRNLHKNSEVRMLWDCMGVRWNRAPQIGWQNGCRNLAALATLTRHDRSFGRS